MYEDVMNVIYEGIGISNENNDIILDEECDQLLDEEYQQLLDEYYEDLDSINESRVFLSDQGKKLKKQIKEKSKAIAPKGIINKVKENLKKKYDPKLVNEMNNFCNKIFDKCYNSPVLETVTTTYVQYGDGPAIPVTTYTYNTFTVAIKGNYMYSFNFILSGARSKLTFLSFNEIDLTQGNISLPMANDIIGILKGIKGYPSVIKNGFTFQKVVGKSDRSKFASALEQLVKKKYPGFKVTGNPLTGSIKIKQKKK